MIEIIGGVVSHPQALHDPAERIVDDGGERDDLVTREVIKPERQWRGRRLGRVAVTPVAAVQPPSNLDGGREVLIEARPIEPDEVVISAMARS